MFLSLQELELRKVRFDEDYPEGEIDFGGEGVRQNGPLHTAGEAELLNNTLGEIRVRGHVQAALAMQCDRCLEPVQYSVDNDFDLFYRPMPRGPLPHEVAIDDGESQIGFYQGHGMDLADVIREHVLLSLPMHQVCREDCAGICPVCGENRNTGACTCAAAPVEQRWAALSKLRDRLPQNRS